MKRENLSNYVGLALLLACFGIALFRISTRPDARPADGTERIRFAHWQLEGGLREAFDQLAREYEALHPGVKVEQIAIPERTYAQWTRTQLIGETITELVQLSTTAADDEMVARFFVPLTEYVEQPNPYNKGTDLENTPLRDTILDGMQGESSYRQNLLEYYGIPVSMFTVRMFYNETLWKQMLGDTPPPQDYESFIKICQRVREIGKTSGRSAIPIAGSKSNAPPILGHLFSSQTQRLNQTLDLQRNMKPSISEIGLSLLEGRWNLDDPAYTSGLRLMREAAAYFQPGYATIARDDASFYFLQGRALMIATGSWDSPGFRSQADFKIGVFSLPIPTAEHSHYGQYMLGRSSEAETGTGLAFGIPKQTKNFDRALDFLHFLSSRKGNATFSRISGWLPAVVGVEPDESVRPFLPVTDGYIGGFGYDFKFGGGNAGRVVSTAGSLLVGQAGSVEAYKDAIRTPIREALRQDYDRHLQVTQRNIIRQDALILAQDMLLHHPDSPSTAHRKIDEFYESQSKLESSTAWIRHELTRIKD